MGSYQIYTDSAADLPQSAYQKYDIRIVPMDYVLNGKSVTFHTEAADHDAHCDELYQAQREGADVQTSQIVPYRYIETWTPELEAGNDILYICFSSGMSATYDNAMSAAQQLKEEYPERTIEVIDSLAATSGEGVMTYTAAVNRESGMSLTENAEFLRSHTKYIRHIFTVGDLNYLHKGGRVSAAVAVIGTMLNIKPILIINSIGKLDVVGKSRGNHQAVKTLLKGFQARGAGKAVADLPKVVYIGHTSRYEEVGKLKEAVQELAGPDVQVEVMCESPIIGVHTGPEFFSICFWGEPIEEDLKNINR
jgi:DegV family protein with EDD domain